MTHEQHQSPATATATAASGPRRETLTGDRLCMQCLHPLVGRTIERDEGTGLLYVRCGECGTPSALFEYPTATPWLQRIKSVVASTLAALAIAASIALAGASGGFSGASAAVASTGSSDTLERLHAQSVPADPADATNGNFGSGRYGRVDEEWLKSDQGQAALAASRRSYDTLLYFALIQSIGLVVATPFAMFLGIALMRHGTVRRALWCGVPVAVGSGIALSINLTQAQFSGAVAAGARFWVQAAEAHNLPFFSVVSLLVTLGYTTLLAVVAPAFAAAVARTILPPRDRRLVGWLWEWRGKPIPSR